MLAKLAPYLAARAQARSDRAAAMWEALTPREQSLVREAAVMGFVQGQVHHDVPVPPDSNVVGITLAAADAMPDLYPTLAALAEPSDR